MKPTHILSINNGWELLVNDKAEEWQSIKNLLDNITTDIITHPSNYIIDKNNENTEDKEEKQEIDGIEANNSFTLQYAFFSIAQLNGWKNSEVVDKITSGLILRLINAAEKNKVNIYFLSNKFYANQLNEIIYILAPRTMSLGGSDLTVVLVPDDSIKNLFRTKPHKGEENSASPIGQPFTGQDCLARLKELYPITNSAPIVFVFFSTEEEEITIEEAPSNQVP